MNDASRWGLGLLFLAAACGSEKGESRDAAAVDTAVADARPAAAGDVGGPGAAFEPTLCPFRSQRSIRCGFVSVPETRGGGDPGRRVRLGVVIVKSTAAVPAADPLLYLEGGPGGSGLATIAALVQPLVSPLDPILAKRDVVAVDQRGTGISQPSLACPELAANPMLDPGMMMGMAAVPTTLVQKCRDRLAGQGIDLGQYQTAAAADDVADLRVALGYSSWNVLGASYGTRLALELVRRRPEGIRSLILDSVLPPQVDWIAESAPNAERSLNLVFEACAAQAACARSYPNLREVFLQLVDTLDASPPQLKTGNSTTPLTGATFAVLIARFLYVPLLIRELPEIIFQVRDEKYALFEQIFTSVAMQTSSAISFGTHFSVMCADEHPFTSADAIAARAMGLPPSLRRSLTSRLYLDVCGIWGVPASPMAVKVAVASPLRTLLLAGQFDPATPPAWARLAAESLAAGRTLEIKGESHGIFPSECGRQLLAGFLDDPDRTSAPGCLQALRDLVFSIRR